MHELLERYLAALIAAGFRSEFMDAPLEADIEREQQLRNLLQEHGFHPRDEVVAYFTWRKPLHEGEARLFWEVTHYIDDVEWLIALHQELHDDMYWDDSKPEVFPGPAYLLPIAVLDGAEYLAVDCRPDPVGGSVWFCAAHATPIPKLFDSLQEAIQAATYCVEASLWAIGENNRITFPMENR